MMDGPIPESAGHKSALEMSDAEFSVALKARAWRTPRPATGPGLSREDVLSMSAEEFATALSQRDWRRGL